MGILRPLTGALLLATTAGCASKAAAPEASAPRALSSLPIAATTRVTSEDFTVPLPSGYADVSAEFRAEAPELSVVLRAKESSRGYQPTIVVRKVPIRGGSFADPATCGETGRGVVAGGTAGPGTGGTLLSATTIDGPIGKTCQIHIRAPQGIALITELHQPGNTPATPQEIWLMTCNHGDGDRDAEAACRWTLAGFRFRER
jgi:hypothetical protein